MTNSFKDYYEIGKLYKRARSFEMSGYMPKTPLILQEIKDTGYPNILKNYVFYSFIDKKTYSVFMNPGVFSLVRNEMDLAIRKVKE